MKTGKNRSGKQNLQLLSRTSTTGTGGEHKLEKADRLLVYALETNCRESIARMARKMGVPKHTVLYRLNQLKKAGVITTFSIIINESKLGYTHFEVWAQFSSIQPERKKELEQDLLARPNVTYIAEVGSPFDLLFGISVRQISEFYCELRSITRQFRDLIQNCSVTISGEAVSYPRSYLLGREDENRSKYQFVIEKSELAEFDKLDANIINELSSNSRIPMLRLAEKLKTSPTTVRSRIKRMEKEGLIETYYAINHPQAIGMQAYELLIATQNMDEQKEKEFETFFRFHGNITLVLRLIGRWDFDIVFDAANFEEYQQFLTEVRTRFGTCLRDYICVPNLRILKHEYRIAAPVAQQPDRPGN